MKTDILLVFLLLAMMPKVVYGQSMSVVEPLEMLPNSQAVVTYNNEFGSFENRYLDDSFPYAVIRIELEGNGEDVREAKARVALDLGRMYAVEAVNKNENNCMLFLVPKGVKNIYVLCGDGCEKQLLHSGSTMSANKVYVCKVRYKKETPAAAPTVVTPATPRSGEQGSQFFVISYKPADALVEIDDVIVEGENGVVGVKLPSGKHNYRVSAENHHTIEDSVIIAEEKVHAAVELRPAYGWIEVSGPEGASVYIDKQKVGEVPMKSGRVSSGSHDVRIVKESYQPYREQVTVSDSAVTRVDARMSAITGALEVNVSPVGAKVYVDGKAVGESPMMLKELIVGEHKVRITASGMREEVQEVLIEEGKTAVVKKSMTRFNGAVAPGVTIDLTKADEAEWYDMDLEELWKMAKGSEERSAQAKMYAILALRGDSRGENGLGECFYYGLGVKQDYAEAVRWYRRAAERGYAVAQYNLGYCYYTRKGVEYDGAEVKRWLTEAARQGNENAKKLLEGMAVQVVEE